MTQCDQVLEHLKTHGRITPMEALDTYKIMRLAARIDELKHRGHHIETRMRKTQAGKRYALYVWASK